MRPCNRGLGSIVICLLLQFFVETGRSLNVLGVLARMKAGSGGLPQPRRPARPGGLDRLLDQQGKLPGLSEILRTMKKPKESKQRVKSMFAGPCLRVSHKVNFGFGLNPHHGNVYVDVGNCTKMPRSFGNFSHSSSARVDAICKRRQACVAIETTQRTVNSRRGPVQVTVAERCGCVPQTGPKSCKRVQQIRTFFRGTKYERKVDVGQCQGLCNKGEPSLHCLPVSKRCTVIKGPNGKQCVEVVKECACQSPCHRIQYKEAFKEFVHDRVLNKTFHETRVIDLGRCVGQCPKLTRSEYCRTLQEPSLRALCQWGGQTKRLHCVPSDWKEYMIRTAADKVITVSAIKRCDCQGG